MTSLLIHRSRQATRDEWVEALHASDDISDVRVAASAEELLARYRQRRPDVVLIGMELESPLEVLAHLRALDPGACVLVVGGGDRALRAAQVIASGARGFVRRDAVADQVAAVRTGVQMDQRTGDPGHRPALTERETQVLHGMSDGRSNLEIGREYFLSEDTIKTHARRLFRKLGANDRAEAVAIGFRMGILR